MASYHLEVLNDKEFEELSKDVLEQELKITFQIFKTGRDGGIDLRYANTEENEIIVQAKRYVRSTYSDLKTTLKKEKASMQKLAKMPKRYILTTTFDMTARQVDELVTLMKPFIRNSHDVYPLERITNLISKYPNIERKYYKLWLTSTNVLNQILLNGVSGRSEFVKEKILKKASLYVPTTNFDVAIEKLKENNFLIVSGEPGIGKTTISYLLICDLLAQGYQLIYVDDHLKDAEDSLSISSDVKQVVFFDDFFGANLSEIINPRNSETKIVSFIERIQSSTNKFLIMTSRTTILKQAQYRFEKFNRSGLADLSKYEIEIKSYSKLDKANILYNHIFHSGISTLQYDIFFKSQNYLKIIKHPNYFPRLIEFITSSNQLKSIPINETEAFIFKSLDNPTEIWHFAYDQQLSEEEKFLLMTLFSLGGYAIKSDELENAFERRYAYEIRENGFTKRTDAYQQSLKKLLDGFIKGEKNLETNVLTFSFLNPSIADFVINFLRERFPEVKRILFSITYFKQLTNYFSPTSNEKIRLNTNQLKEFYNQFQLILPRLLDDSVDLMADNITTLFILLTYFEPFVKEEQLYEIISVTDICYSPSLGFGELMTVLNRLVFYNRCHEHITKNWQEFFVPAVELCEDTYDFQNILATLEIFEINNFDWSHDKKFMKALKTQVNETYSAYEVDLSRKTDVISDAYYSGYHDHALEIIEEEVSNDYHDFLHSCNLSEHFNEFYTAADVDKDGILNSLMDELNNRQDEYEPNKGFTGTTTGVNEDEAIRRLFER